jgi:hypothetical protein
VSDAGLDERGIPDLVGDVLRAVFGLGRNTARMFGLEARDVSRRLGRRVALLIASTVFAAAGLLAVLGGLASLAERAFRLPLWAGLSIVGAAALGVGALGIRAALRRLGDADLAFPETVAELSKDADAFASPPERRP